MSNTDNTTFHVTDYKRPWWKGLRNWWPLLVFIAVTVMAVGLYTNGGKYRVLTGTAERIVETIAPLDTARIASIEVAVGDHVKAGDIIAHLNTAMIDAEAAVLREQIEQSQLESQLEQLTLERQFSSALQEAEQALREAELEYKVSQVEHEALTKEINRLQPLYEQRLIEAELFVAKKAREEVLGEMLKLMPTNIQALQQDVEQSKSQKASAMQRLEAMKQSATENSGNGETLNLLKIRRDAYTLRVQQDGVVVSIDCQAGDVIESGGSIASILIDGPARIVGFLPENNLSTIEVGTPAIFYPSVSLKDTGVIPGHVLQISPAIYSLPERVSPIRGQVVRGRRVIFELDKEVTLVPGESISIEIEASLFPKESLDN